MKEQTHLVLEPGTGVDHVVATAENAGWTTVLDEPRDGNRPRRLAWEGRWDDVRIYYVDDHLIKVPYLIVRGPDREEAVLEVRLLIPSFDLVRAIPDALCAATREDKVEAIRRIAVLAFASPPLRIVLTVFDGAFTDADPEVRRMAVGASTYPAWREFEPRLEILANGDEDDGVRDLAVRTLAALRRHDWD